MKRLLLFLITAIVLAGCTGPGSPTTPTETQSIHPTEEGYGTGLGQKIQDFAVTTVDDQEILLSDLLKEKKLVVLNFWFADCGWCIKEFPVLELAYSRYKDDIEVLALTPYDDRATAAAFAEEHSLSFPVATCLSDFPQAFGVGGYPTSVFIDREGRISLIHSGAITNTEIFYAAFDAYTAEDYSHATYYKIEELVR